MANPEAGTSGDVAPASGCEYQVFLNFRGFDTHHGFTDFLYNHLVDVGIRVFRDDDELKVGEVIGENLVGAINNSIIYIPIFSKNYASSKWCLLELAHIVNNVSNSKDKKSIIPIFFNVKSDDVKLKTSVYSNALSEHERKSPDQVKVWKVALAKVGEIKGSNVEENTRDYPLDDYRELSRKIVSLMGGLPLAIEVVGSLLKYKEDKTIWEEKIIKLTEVLDKGILDVLKISYDELDEFQKKIFLDIACFFFNEKKTDAIFFNEKKTDAIYMWESCKFYPRGGIEVLTKRCLIKTLDDDKFWMHDHLIALGKQIVYEENQDDPAKRSRLWNAEEALQIIGTEERKDKVQAIEIDGLDDNIEVKSEDFKSLPNLRFLRLGHGTFVEDFSKCRSNLRWISWRHPENFRANNIYLDRLIVFKLDISILEDDSKAWDLIKRARNLKVLSLTRCHGITRIPDFSKCLGLEKLTLKRCSRLKRIDSFIGDLRLLIKLEVERCNVLTNVEGLHKLRSLEYLEVIGCTSLGRFIGASATNIPDDCSINIEGIITNRYGEETLPDTSNEV
ncbi:disease resistance protein RUN1-like [Eucalyptus grandis]|uniref:disease resistance protein RUN1-like n=1 Tax=Eucalyptus grandis TaxID=71139 RepID=UPI00192EE39E|nr:disease resistance protein RUN1-like [Eucalyptus grandis]